MPDRKNVIRLIEEEISVCESVNQCYRTIDLPALRDILALLKEQEAIVRCKDCKNFDGLDCKVNDITNIMDTNWFCADGKRKEGGEVG